MKYLKIAVTLLLVASLAVVLFSVRKPGVENDDKNMDKFFTISKDGLSVELCYPSAAEGYYRGTRFDWAGVFRRIVKDGHVYADEWFDADEPYRHDNVCGLSEEFVIFENDAAGPFVKIGVGKLMKEEGPYDRFKLYPIVDGGARGLEIGDDSVVFTHLLEGEYEYEKKIVLLDGETLRIDHELKNISSETLETRVYNHNFFTFDDMRVGPAVRIDFPACISGHWRDVMPEVNMEGNSIVFHGNIVEGQKAAFIGDLAVDHEPFSFLISNSEKNLAVNVQVNAPVSHSVFYSNHRVSCIEPYTPLTVAPGETVSWSIDYRFK